MSGRDLFFLLSPIVGLHFICMNFSCLNVARLNNEHLQCKPLSLSVCFGGSSFKACPPPQVFLRCLLIFHGNRSFRLLFMCAHCRNMKDWRRERTTFDGDGCNIRSLPKTWFNWRATVGLGGDTWMPIISAPSRRWFTSNPNHFKTSQGRFKKFY